MEGDCYTFEPNPWRPKICKHCLKAHNSNSPLNEEKKDDSSTSKLVTSTSKKRISAIRPAQKQPPSQPLISHHTTRTPIPIQQQHVNDNKGNNNPSSAPSIASSTEGVKRKKGTTRGSVACNSFSPQRWRTSICMSLFLFILFLWEGLSITVSFIFVRFYFSILLNSYSINTHHILFIIISYFSEPL